jgi:uncharacterized protein (TIGR01777 family)
MIFHHSTTLPVPASDLFAWHARPGAFERLTPPWERVRIRERGEGLADGSRVVLEVRMGPFKKLWVARHRDVRENEGFTDIQEEGPFASWKHEHRMIPEGSGSSRLEERIEYELPLGRLGKLLGGRLVRSKLERLFRYRHRVTEQDLRAHLENGRTPPMKIVISGASGLVGSTLLPLLTTGGHQVTRLVRGKEARGEAEVSWDPERGILDPAAFDGAGAVVHLAGENIASGRWTETRKQRIRRSRVEGTRLLAAALSRCENPPEVLVSASAVGFYGNRGGEELTEESAPGEGFLAGVCREWEAATEAARDKGVRVVNLRIGIVLSPAGGALRKLLTPFRMGAGGHVGSGRQYMSWIALDDLVYAILHVMTRTSLSGAVNAVSPNPVTNREFTTVLGKVLSRPTLMPVPAMAARLAFGEMAKELLLASQRVKPTRLLKSGFSFRFSELEDALRHLLGQP